MSHDDSSSDESDYDGEEVERYGRLKKYVSRLAVGCKPKKARTFTSSQIEEFLTTSDDIYYFAMKVILIFGICGALQCCEFTEMFTPDVENTGTQYIVTIKDTKSYYPRKFVIGPMFYRILQKYVGLRPDDFGTATLLSHSGANLVDVKSLGGWKSDKVCQGYIENSDKHKEELFQGVVSGFRSMDSPCKAPLQENINAQNVNNDTRSHGNTSASKTKQVSVTLPAQKSFQPARLFRWKDMPKTTCTIALSSAKSVTPNLKFVSPNNPQKSSQVSHQSNSVSSIVPTCPMKSSSDRSTTSDSKEQSSRIPEARNPLMSSEVAYLVLHLHP
ncbi:hypothetical protein QAD02_019877 [Eretmocerus hayati]|uniref:Uncharacterized protein n=1 Tax=Eretmocerus hayati TaxID=131215 RepID=A0ACC2PKG9_9HYME|nr:hypothetical protein QAD02_019877 [Eretmocerus hayati]